MDDVEILIEKIKQDRNFQRTPFTSNFLNNVADVFEREGFGVTKTFLLDKQQKYNLKWQAISLLNILNIFEKNERIKQNRKIGRFIIKNLNNFKYNKL